MSQFEPSPEGVVLPKSLGRRILEIMEEKGKAFTLQAFASRIGMNRVTLSKKLNGERDLYMFELRRIAEFLKIKVERIMQTDFIDEEKELKLLFEALLYPQRMVEIANTLNDSQRFDIKDMSSRAQAENYIKNRTLELALLMSTHAIGATERSKTLNDLGRAYYYLRDSQQAHDSWLKAYDFVWKIKKENDEQSKILFDVTANLTISYSIRKEYSYLSEIIARIEPMFHTSPRRSADMCYSLAKIAEDQGNFEEARIQYNKSIELNRMTENPKFVGKATHNAACFEYRQKDYLKAKKLFELALIDLVDYNYENLICRKEFCKTLLKLGENEKAETIISECLSEIDASDMEDNLKARYMLLLSKSRTDQRIADEVLAFENLDLEIKMIACRFLMDLAEQKGDLEAVMNYYRIAKNISKANIDLLDEEGL